jgi:hypothetical protein
LKWFLSILGIVTLALAVNYLVPAKAKPLLARLEELGFSEPSRLFLSTRVGSQTKNTNDQVEELFRLLKGVSETRVGPFSPQCTIMLYSGSSLQSQVLTLQFGDKDKVRVEHLGKTVGEGLSAELPAFCLRSFNASNITVR